MALNTLKDCYEAYVIYIFLQLLIQYLDGEDALLAVLDNESVILLFTKVIEKN